MVTSTDNFSLEKEVSMVPSTDNNSKGNTKRGKKNKNKIDITHLIYFQSANNDDYLLSNNDNFHKAGVSTWYKIVYCRLHCIDPETVSRREFEEPENLIFNLILEFLSGDDKKVSFYHSLCDEKDKAIIDKKNQKKKMVRKEYSERIQSFLDTEIPFDIAFDNFYHFGNIYDRDEYLYNRKEHLNSLKLEEQRCLQEIEDENEYEDHYALHEGNHIKSLMNTGKFCDSDFDDLWVC
tara:strand:+ start:1584 stop:2291 length:708 start_codon:yes stop_codon:yes gene_type:complete